MPCVEVRRKGENLNVECKKEIQILNFGGVDCYEKDGTAYLKLEAVARGLGFTTIAKSGNEVIRWNTVHGYLKDLGVATSCNGSCYQDECPDFIPENIFYRLAMKAKNEAAEKFQTKVADEIIPSIRKYGGYIAGQENMSDDELLEKAVLVAKRKIAERDAIIQNQSKQIEEMKPAQVFSNAVTASKTTILVGELAKILKQNGIEIGEKRLFSWLRSHGYLISRKGTDYNAPTQKSMELGLFEVKETAITHSDGHTTVNKTTKVTGKGQQYFINKFLGQK